MEAQTLINAAIALSGFFGGWVLTRITHSLDRLDNEVSNMQEKYVRRDDYIRDISEIKSMLINISNKLDNKADKH
jgi:hypothetical protein